MAVPLYRRLHLGRVGRTDPLISPGNTPQNTKGQPGLFSAALFGLCPHCSARTLFAAPAQVADHCRACDFDYAGLERGGRFAGLVTIAVAVLLCSAALGLDALFQLPIAVQFAIWAPLTVGGVLYALRFYKTLLIYAAYERRHGESEGPKA